MLENLFQANSKVHKYLSVVYLLPVHTCSGLIVGRKSHGNTGCSVYDISSQFLISLSLTHTALHLFEDFCTVWLKEGERKHTAIQRKVLISKEVKSFPGETKFLCWRR